MPPPGPDGRAPRPAYLLGFVLLGVSLTFSGPAMTHLRDQVGASIGQGGWIVAGQSAGYIVTSLAVARRFDRGRGHRTMVQAAAIVAAVVVAIDAATELWQLVVGFAVIGAGAAATDVGGNTLIAWSEPPERVGPSLNLLHLCFGIGAIGTPLVVAAAIDRTGGLVPLAAVLAVGAVALAAVLARSRQPTPRHEDEHHVPVDPAHRRELLRLVQVFFFVYVGAEASMAVWVTTWAEDLDLSVARGPALLTATFWAGFTLGRLAAVAATHRWPVAQVLVASCAASAVATATLGGADTIEAVAWVGTALVGFALGPQFATMFAVADGAIGLDGATTAQIVAASGLGSLTIPWATGLLLDARGTGLLPAVVLVGAVGSTVAAVAVTRLAARRTGYRQGWTPTP